MLHISDLDHLHPIESSAISGSAGTAINAIALAIGDTTDTRTNTISRARLMPSGASISISLGRATGFAADPVDAAVFVGVTGAAEGQITIQRTRSRIVDRGNVAFGIARGIFIAIDPP